MKPNQTYISATEARNNFFELLEKVKKGPFPINITVKGIPEVVLMSKEDYDGWMATIETLSDPELMDGIREAEKNFKEGKYQTLEEVEKEFGYGKYATLSDIKKKYVSNTSRKSGKKRIEKTR